jgi:hypothetical protein
MRDAALAHLESLLCHAPSPAGPGRARWPAHVEGTLLAYQRIGVLSSSEARRWSVRLASGDSGRDTEPEPSLPEAARAAGAQYLERLVAGVPPFRRNPTAEELAADAECAGALEALRAVGVLDEREHTEWSRRLLAAQAPWLEEPTPPPGDGAWAISIPPETPEEAAEDAAFEAAWAARPKAETTRRVVVGSPERHTGLAMIALAVHEDATSLHFHFVGEPADDARDSDSLRDFEAALDALGPPALHDDRGVSYEPVEPRPVSASSHSSEPDSDPRRVIIGAWLYAPAAPDEAASFEIEQAGQRWTLPVAT